MGWKDCHLHSFSLGKKPHQTIYQTPMDEEEVEYFKLKGKEYERKYTLFDLNLDQGEHFEYMYDFGDGWKHRIEVEKVMPFSQEIKHPLCLEATRACPPEDCGGTGEYEDLLEALNAPSHENHKHIKKWVGSKFDPEKVDLEEINQQLSRMKLF